MTELKEQPTRTQRLLVLLIGCVLFLIAALGTVGCGALELVAIAALFGCIQLGHFGIRFFEFQSYGGSPFGFCGHFSGCRLHLSSRCL